MAIQSTAFLLAVTTLLVTGTSMAQSGRGGVAASGVAQSARSGGTAHFARPVTSGVSRPYGLRTDIPPPVGLNPPAASYTGILPGVYKQSYGNGRGNRGGGGLIGGPLYFPYLGYDSTAASFPSYNETIDPNAQAFAAVQDSLGEQIRQLSVDLASMKQQMYTPPSEVASPTTHVSNTDSQSTDHPAVSVVLKSGQTYSVQSYAVMNGFLWDFSKQPVRKIALSNIDVPASVKATEANGSEFPEIAVGK